MSRFSISADHCPSTLCRVAGLLAQRGITPTMLSFVNNEDGCSIEVEFDCVDAWAASVIAEKIRNIIPVHQVALDY